jgi:hypothetical protein
LQLLDLNRGQGQTLPPLVNHPSTKPKLLADNGPLTSSKMIKKQTDFNRAVFVLDTKKSKLTKQDRIGP